MSIFRFKGRATGSDPEGYYHPRWDRAQSVSVLAETKAAATSKALAMLGDHPRFARSESRTRNASTGWAVVWDSIDEEPVVAESGGSR